MKSLSYRLLKHLAIAMTGTESPRPEQRLTDLELDLSDDLIQEIRRYAAKTGVSPEEWARAAIRFDIAGDSRGSRDVQEGNRHSQMDGRQSSSGTTRNRLRCWRCSAVSKSTVSGSTKEPTTSMIAAISASDGS